MSKICLLFIIVLQTGLLFGQKPYCNQTYHELRALIGQQLKIYHNGGVYTTLNETDAFDWPSDSLKQKAGHKAWGYYYPSNGEIGTVVHIFTKWKKEYVYVLKIGDYYVPVSCNYIVAPDQPDVNEESRNQERADSLRNLEYANGCIFKLNGRNGGCARGGFSPLVKDAEEFCCQLLSQGVDTILKLYYHGGNGEGTYAYTGVIWQHNGHYYFRRSEYRQTGIREEIADYSVTEFMECRLFDDFFADKIFEPGDDPEPDIIISHDQWYDIELYAGVEHYCHALANRALEGEPDHVKSIWWKAVIDAVEHNTHKKQWIK